MDAADRRTAIMVIATPLFARRGFAGTTTKEIAEAAGVSEALLFRHFIEHLSGLLENIVESLPERLIGNIFCC